jgi:outer membrane lipoprotein SlyB
MKHTVKVLALFAVIGLSGCGASNSDLEVVRTLAQQANTTADVALQTARSAENIAMDAKASAEAAENKIENMAKGQKTKHK